MQLHNLLGCIKEILHLFSSNPNEGSVLASSCHHRPFSFYREEAKIATIRVLSLPQKSKGVIHSSLIAQKLSCL
jgi:hypothetical protein